MAVRSLIRPAKLDRWARVCGQANVPCRCQVGIGDVGALDAVHLDDVAIALDNRFEREPFARLGVEELAARDAREGACATAAAHGILKHQSAGGAAERGLVAHQRSRRRAEGDVAEGTVIDAGPRRADGNLWAESVPYRVEPGRAGQRSR